MIILLGLCYWIKGISMKQIFLVSSLLFFMVMSAYAQTLINSFDDQYNRSFMEEENGGFFNSLRSFSFNKYPITENSESDLFTVLDTYSLSSYNTYYAHGMNDESFWQGKGLNTFLTGGIKGQYKNLSIIIYPEIWFAQNDEFSIVPPSANQENEYASFIGFIDNPQRYGNGYVFHSGFGQSEIRYTGEKLTVGIGTQSLWIGPGVYNSLILSNNAGGFPKIDIGVRNINSAIGEFEFFTWWGLLRESHYFDSDSTNNENLFTGIHLDYKPVFIDGLTIGINRTLTANLADAGISSFGTLLIPVMTTLFGHDLNDQRASITLDWTFPIVGFNTYLEWARNDYQPSVRSIIQFPQRTQAYTIGARQLVYNKGEQRCLVTLEISELLVSWDYTIDGTGGPSFYTHGIVTQGYTQDGQILGAGIGTGSNSQILRADYYYERGKLSGYFQRIARTPDYLFSLPIGSPERSSNNNNVEFTIGTEWVLNIFTMHTLVMGVEYSRNFNWNYIAGNDVNNFHFELGYSLSY